MHLMNTERNYGAIAKWLHWVTALLFFVAYISVYYRHWFTEPDTSSNMVALYIHLSVGLSVAVLVIPRIIWKFSTRSPKQEPGKRIEHIAAHAGHYALYAIMIITPVTGYVGTGINTQFFGLFNIPRFADTQFYNWMISLWPNLEFDIIEGPIDFIHKDILGAYLVWLLIVGHVAAALFHHFVKGDRTLKKMTSGK